MLLSCPKNNAVEHTAGSTDTTAKTNKKRALHSQMYPAKLPRNKPSHAQ